MSSKDFILVLDSDKSNHNYKCEHDFDNKCTFSRKSEKLDIILLIKFVTFNDTYFFSNDSQNKTLYFNKFGGFSGLHENK